MGKKSTFTNFPLPLLRRKLATAPRLYFGQYGLNSSRHRHDWKRLVGYCGALQCRLVWRASVGDPTILPSAHSWSAGSCTSTYCNLFRPTANRGLACQAYVTDKTNTWYCYFLIALSLVSWHLYCLGINIIVRICKVHKPGLLLIFVTNFTRTRYLFLYLLQIILNKMLIFQAK